MGLSSYDGPMEHRKNRAHETVPRWVVAERRTPGNSTSANATCPRVTLLRTVARTAGGVGTSPGPGHARTWNSTRAAEPGAEHPRRRRALPGPSRVGGERPHRNGGPDPPRRAVASSGPGAPARRRAQLSLPSCSSGSLPVGSRPRAECNRRRGSSRFAREPSSEFPPGSVTVPTTVDRPTSSPSRWSQEPGQEPPGRTARSHSPGWSPRPTRSAH